VDGCGLCAIAEQRCNDPAEDRKFRAVKFIGEEGASVLFTATLLRSDGVELLGFFEPIALGLDLDDLAAVMRRSTRVTTPAQSGDGAPPPVCT
jgi:hypothetical protein